ncbi:MAG: hypothetical protein SP4CHLAM5_05820 [Chlamydiia bacterium]|nr:hypothetical protein [Chlamydiia bacterium]MCH9618452.1 hypothetical protein [Chlamydiia bacterium]
MQISTTLSATTTTPTSLGAQDPEQKYVKVEWAVSGNIVGGVAHPYTNADTVDSLLQRLTGHLLGPKGSVYTGHDVYLDHDFIGKSSLDNHKLLHTIKYSTDILNLVVVKRRELESVASLKGYLIDILANSPSSNQRDRIFEIVLSLFGSTASYKQKRVEAIVYSCQRRIHESFLKGIIIRIGRLHFMGRFITFMKENKADNLFLLSHVIDFYSSAWGYTPSDLGKLRDIVAEMDLENVYVEDNAREKIDKDIDCLDKQLKNRQV